MPTLKVLDMAGKEVGDISLSDDVFGIEPNAAVLHAAVRAYLMNQRQGTHSTLTRAEVRGGGRKPWRQKGTGRARHGSIRSPQWTHGGVAHGPKPRCYRVTLNKKVRRLALRSALSAKVAGGEMIVVDAIQTNEYKTKTMVSMLRSIGAEENKTLVVLPERDETVLASLRNIEGVKDALPTTLNTYDILNCDRFVVAEAAARKIEEVYAP